MHRHHRHNFDSVAIGRFAGEDSTTEYTVSIGRKAGNSQQAEHAIAIGDQAGVNTQSNYAIAIGDTAGKETQGAYAIAIGATAGVSTQPDNSIILNAMKDELSGTDPALYINPIRKLAKQTNMLSYNPISMEVSLSFPQLPQYASDADATTDYIKANTVKLATPSIPPATPATAPVPLTKPTQGTLYYDTTKNKIKYWNDKKWVAITDEEDLAKLKAELMAAIKAAGSSASTGSNAAAGGVGNPGG